MKKHALLVCLATLSFVACTSSPKIYIPESKVLGYHFDFESKKKMKQPYVAKFKKGKKELFYVLSKHVSDKTHPNLLNHPTNITIRKLFKKHHPQVVIVEGLPSQGELSPKRFLAHTKNCKKRNFKGCGESFYAIDQAIQLNAEYVSGEPSEKEIQEFVRQSGFSQKDLLGFYLVRQIPQMKRRNEFVRALFEKDSTHFLERYRKRLGMKERFDYTAFKEWYEANMSKPKSFLDIENNDAAPHGGTDATYVQRISHLVGLARDRVIVKRIESMLNQFDRVLIIYGGSHYLLQEEALKDALGEPIFFREST